MTQLQKGDTVRIHYTGRLTDGTQFDSSQGREPLQFQLGSGQIIPGLDDGIQGLTVGEKATITVPAESAYGEHKPEGVQKLARDRIPPEVDLSLGARLQATSESGQQMTLTVVDLGDAEVTVDANHPLAGKDLVFDIEVLERV